MTNRIGGRSPSVPHARTAETKTPAGKAESPKASKKTEVKLPRTGWEDGARLSKEIDRSKKATQPQEHPRLRHTHPAHPSPITDHHPPPIAMRYGVIRPDPDPPKPPPIAMRYGVIRPDPAPPKPPPIAMRYGVIRPDPNPPKPPPIAMRYGVIRPDPAPPKPPPIAMRYGVIRPEPRDGIETKPR